MPTKGLDGIEEGKVGDEDVEEDSEKSDEIFGKKNSRIANESHSSDSCSNDDSGESSIDMDGDEDEEKLYA